MAHQATLQTTLTSLEAIREEQKVGCNPSKGVVEDKRLGKEELQGSLVAGKTTKMLNSGVLSTSVRGGQGVEKGAASMTKIISGSW